MLSRANRIYFDYPDLVKGYELNTERGLFSVIIPEATTNLVTNPSMHGAVTTGYTAVGGAMAAVATWQAYGAYGMRLTPAVSTESGLYYGTIALASGSTYTFSATVQGEAGKIYYIWFATSAGALLGSKQVWYGTGHKQRISVTYTETANASRRFYITRDAKYTDQNLFYADGFQVEEKSYPTTYCDGDQVGFVTGELAYYWNGTPRASTSTRSAQTRSGGKEVNLLNFGLHILAIVGLGMAPLVDRSLTIPGLGEVPQETGTMAREFTIIGAVDSIAGQRNLKELRSGLIDAFKPDLTVNDQPMILRYQEYDGDDVCGEILDIICKYRGGLEGQWDNNHGERLALNFKMYLPLIQSTFGSGTILGYQTTVANANLILKRGTDGIWAAMGTGVSGGLFPKVYTLSLLANGNIYAGGTFTDFIDVNGDNITSWNGTAWASVGTGTDDSVTASAIGPDQSLYIGGLFHLAGGVANTVHIAKWNGAAYSALGTGMDDIVNVLAFDPFGNLYAGGDFHLAGGVANTVHIAKWNGIAWTAMGTGTDGPVEAIVCDTRGNVYIGGNFTLAGGVAGTSNIAKWNYVTSAWEPLGTGISGGEVKALIFDNSGNLIAAGAFSSAGGIAANKIAKWNGSAWSPLGSGLDNIAWALALGPDNNIYVGGVFSTAGGITLPDRMAMWNGSVWAALDVDLPGTPTVYSILFDKVGNLYVAFGTAGNAVSATVTVSGSGNSKTYPKIIFTGAGSILQIKNYSTGKSIYFDLTLLGNEVAILNLDPTNISFVSSWRGNILSKILPGSSLDFELMPGNNNVSAYYYAGTDATSAIVMTWVDRYSAIDGAAWK